MKTQNLIIVILFMFWISACNTLDQKEMYYFPNTDIPVAGINSKSSKLLFIGLQEKDSFVFYPNEQSIIVDNLQLQTTKTKGFAYLIIKGHNTDSLGVTVHHKVAYPIVSKDNSAKTKAVIAHQCRGVICDNCDFEYNELGEICGCKCMDSANNLGKCDHSITTILQPLQPR